MHCGQWLLDGLDRLLLHGRDLLHGIGQPDIVGQFGKQLDEIAIGRVGRLERRSAFTAAAIASMV